VNCDGTEASFTSATTDITSCQDVKLAGHVGLVFSDHLIMLKKHFVMHKSHFLDILCVATLLLAAALVAAAVAAAGASLKEVIRSPTRHVRFAAARSRIKLKE